MTQFSARRVNDKPTTRENDGVLDPKKARPLMTILRTSTCVNTCVLCGIRDACCEEAKNERIRALLALQA